MGVGGESVCVCVFVEEGGGGVECKQHRRKTRIHLVCYWCLSQFVVGVFMLSQPVRLSKRTRTSKDAQHSL